MVLLKYSFVNLLISFKVESFPDSVAIWVQIWGLGAEARAHVVILTCALLPQATCPVKGGVLCLVLSKSLMTPGFFR
ncbi:hypothetical protein KC19_5G052500 [Ceratodon purpureus]|uniref:Uncharacterized protein n=1 Tax=Ceratodon purpureus TaxID=3225 RepID=A0A8T0HY61_CERPU|nr:hypothetical protein KC19_5G052500 [Ceratodon purpureus]